MGLRILLVAVVGSGFGVSTLASAASATCYGCDARVDFVNPSHAGYRITTNFDGTNHTVDLSAEVEQSVSNLPRAGWVSFYYSLTDPGCAPGPRIKIGVAPIVQHADPSATTGWSYKLGAAMQWAPPQAGTYCMIAALEQVGTHAHLPNYVEYKNIIIDNTSPAAFLSQPSVLAGWIPVYNGNANLKGTASANPLPNASAGFGNAAHSSLTFDGQSTNWSAVMAAPPQFMPTTSANKFLPDYRGAHVEVNATDARAWGTISTLYQQRLVSFAGAPASAVRAVYSAALPIDPATTGSTQRQRYAWTAKDQQGRTIPGLPVAVTVTDPNGNASYCVFSIGEGGTAVPASAVAGAGVAQCGPGATTTNNSVPAVVRTDAFGRLRLDVMNTDVESVTIEVRTHFAGAVFVAGRDRADSATYTTTSGMPRHASLTLTGHPDERIYPTQTYASPLGPTLTVHVDDGAGDPVSNQPVVVQTTRTIVSGQTAFDQSSYPLVFPEATTPGTDASGNVEIPLYPVPVLPTARASSPTPVNAALSTDGEAGFDVVRTYIDLDSVPGLGASDLLIGTAVIRFGPQRIFAVPCGQSVPGSLPSSVCPMSLPSGASSSTLTFINTIYDGTQYVRLPNRPLQVTVTKHIAPSGAATPFVGTAGSGFGFVAGGALVLSGPLTGTIPTDPSGTASVKVFSSAAQRFVVTASDPALGVVTTSDNGVAVTRFTGPVTLGAVAVIAARRHGITGDLPNVPGAPGQPLVFSAKLTDASGTALADRSVRLRVTRGFFVPPTNASAAGQGSPPSMGTSIVARTDSSGYVRAAVSIGRDAGLDLTGDVQGVVTVTFGTITKTLRLPAGKAPAGTLFSTNFARDGGSSLAGTTAPMLSCCGNDVLAGGSRSDTSASEGGGEAVYEFSTSGTTLNVYAYTFDLWGNLVRETLNVADSQSPTVAIKRTGAFVRDTQGAVYTVTNAASGASRRSAQTVTFSWRGYALRADITWA